jgi:periodic tryptophan protein 1
VGWVKCGSLKQNPNKFKEEEGHQFRFQDQQQNNNDTLNMQNYDVEEGNPVFSDRDNITFKNNYEDPYLNHGHEDDFERDDFLIKHDDMVVIAGVPESEGNEISQLNVYIFVKEDESFYLHHDYMLPSFPLCMTWYDYVIGKSLDENVKGNFVAVGTFEPYIEIWDLDTVDSPMPIAVLGGPLNEEDFFSDTKNVELKENSHKEAVLSLSWNRIYRNIISSSSADTTVKLWDLANEICLHTYNIHDDKVQCLAWNPTEATILVTGGFDRKVNVLDVRNPNSLVSTSLQGEIECVTWLPSPHHNHLLCSDEAGFLYCFDILKGLEQPLWSIRAHENPCQSIAVNPIIPGFIATGSPEKGTPVKFWDIYDGNPVCLYSETGDLGNVFSLSFSVDDPYYLCVGANSDKPFVINTTDYEPIKNKYGNQNFEKQELAIIPSQPFSIPDANPQGNNNNNNNNKKKRKIKNN